eukprot:TRINITY_DN80868_c0_g1_i1.p1 TRINITY_DN80868_c0_g1~~TRINITY_DN80868_c0_g1_i1.p1  ORF type:complete len:289 (+),score=45.69 TRINITY_DN80868_c0_g1_i1:94-867(+)
MVEADIVTLPLVQHPRTKSELFNVASPSPSSSACETGTRSPFSNASSSSYCLGDGASMEAPTPATLWPSTPTPDALHGGQLDYSFGLPTLSHSCKTKLNSNAKAFVPILNQAPEQLPESVDAASVWPPETVWMRFQVQLREEVTTDVVADGSICSTSTVGLQVQSATPSASCQPSATGKESDDMSDSSFPSKGAELHGTGQCKPCAWLWKPKGCQNAKDCNYCHLCPEGEMKIRKKAKIAAIRMGLLPSHPGKSEEE